MTQDYSFWEYDTYHRIWDYCIIGSGITGISTGISILEKNPEASVLIIDRWFIPLGASTRNAGFSCFGSPSEILDDIATMGEEDAISLISKRWKGLQKLQNRLSGSFAQYERQGGYELYNEDEFENIYSRLAYLNQLLEHSTGNVDVFTPVKVPEGIRGFTRAINNTYEGQLHPGFMMEHLKQIYLGLGGKMWTGLNIDRIEEGDGTVFLRSKLALPVEAKKVIVTTNAFVKELLPDLDVYGARNHVLVTGPLKGLAWNGCFHYDKGFLYFRNIGNRILLGGGRNKDFSNEKTDQFGENQLIKEVLENFLYTHLAEKASCTIEYRWSGIIGIGNKKLPIVKSLSPQLFVGVRCSGMGIALASVIGEELSDLVLQQSE